MTNFGLDIPRELEEQDGTEYLAGSLTCIAEIPVEEREGCLPQGEVQRGAEDTMSCASNSPLNILKAKLNYILYKNLLSPENRQWLFDNKYVWNAGGDMSGVELSDAFIAIKSGTTRRGNSMKSPLQAMHEYGVIPKAMLPLTPDMTFDQFHNPERITKEMEELGQEFLKRFPLFYEKEEDVQSDRYMLCVGGYAWSQPVNGIYPRTQFKPNHEFVKYKKEHLAFDSYRDSFDGDFIKQLASDYKFLNYAYRVVIQQGSVESKKKWWEFLLDLLKTLLKKH